MKHAFQTYEQFQVLLIFSWGSQVASHSSFKINVNYFFKQKIKGCFQGQCLVDNWGAVCRYTGNPTNYIGYVRFIYSFCVQLQEDLKYLQRVRKMSLIEIRNRDDNQQPRDPIAEVHFSSHNFLVKSAWILSVWNFKPLGVGMGQFTSCFLSHLKHTKKKKEKNSAPSF